MPVAVLEKKCIDSAFNAFTIFMTNVRIYKENKDSRIQFMLTGEWFDIDGVKNTGRFGYQIWDKLEYTDEEIYDDLLKYIDSHCVSYNIMALTASPYPTKRSILEGHDLIDVFHL